MAALRAGVTARPWLSGSVVAALIVAAGGAYWFTRPDSTANASTSYRLVAASLGTVRQSVTTTGTVEPAQQQQLSFAASGTVTSVRVAQGDRVKSGQVLATIDSVSLQAALAEAEATLATDQAKVASDEAQGITGTQLTADQAAVTAASGQADSARAGLDGATLHSPISGVVASVDIVVGDQVSGSSSTGSSSSGNNRTPTDSSSSSTPSGSSSAQFVIIGTTSWVVNATVDDTQVGLVKKGNQAQITTGGATGTVYGTISSVGVVADSSSTTPAYPVVVAVTGNPSGLHAGASATVELIYRQLTNVLTVPTLAVHAVNGTSVVYELERGKRVAHTVTTGLSSGGETQIRSGLAENDRVVVDVPTRSNSGSGSSRRVGNNGPGGGQFIPGGGDVQIPVNKLPIGGN